MINLERRGGDFTCENMMLHDTSAFFATRVILFLMFEKVFFYNHVCVEIIFLCVMIMSNCVIIFSVSAEIVTGMNLTRPLRFVSVLTVHLYKLSPFQTFILPNQSILLLTPGNVKINVGLPQTFVLYMLTITVESCSRNKNERTT